MTHVVVVADRIADAGFRVLRDSPALEVIPVVGDPAGLRRALPRVDQHHARIARTEIERAPNGGGGHSHQHGVSHQHRVNSPRIWDEF